MKRLFTIIFLLTLTTVGYAQQVKVYKIEDLEKRVLNDSDTTYIVNFWATWCAPCVKELPAFDSIHDGYQDKKIKVLLVSLDFKEDVDKKVVPFIKNKKVQSEVVVLDEINGNYFIPKVSAEWSGAIPATWFISKKKAVNRFFEKKVTVDFLQHELKNIP